jgi:hypothetical protein
MRTLSRFNFTPVSRRAGVMHALTSALLIGVTSPAILAQNTADDVAKRRRGSATDEKAGGRRGSPEEMQARMLSSLRERLEVPDDEEWKIISVRLGKVVELRRSTIGTAGGIAAAFAGRGSPGGDNRGGRGRTAGNPEMSALQSAVRDKLPDAEIKSRLDRLRQSRRDNETKLSQAQEELRAVLSIRQEAVAVVFGLLP